MSRADYLFSEGDLGSALRAQEQQLNQAAEGIPADHALAASLEELATELVERFRIEPLAVDEAGATVSHEDTRIDVSGDRNRIIFDRSQPFYMGGTKLTYHVPVSGELDLFKARPSSFTLNPPIASIAGSELRIVETVPAPIPDGFKGRFTDAMAQVRQWVGWVNVDVAGFNDRLPGIARDAAQRRQDKVRRDHDLVASLGIPVRRADAPTTYAAPPVRRKVPAAAVTRTNAKALEPVLPADAYEHILWIVTNMAQVMERSPQAFATMDEEALRQHFLVQLNGQYEGDATGETFNFEGKTDILIRRNGRNIFIAECKFWDGAKILTKTVDQILGYASWRDTKTAIFLFNRGRALSGVLAQISPTVAAHPNFVREIPYDGETGFRFIIRHRDDPERELTLTVLVFEVPG